MKHNFLHHNWLVREPCNHCTYRNTPANGPFCGGCLDKPKTSESKEENLNSMESTSQIADRKELTMSKFKNAKVIMKISAKE